MLRPIMTISITLTPDQERMLEAMARRSGKDPSTYVNDLITAHLNDVEPRAEKTFDQVLAPVWEDRRQSGMTEEEVDAMFQRELEEFRQERLQRRGME